MMTNDHTLLIVEEYPKEVSLYLIPNAVLSTEDIDMLRSCHLNFANSSDVSREVERYIEYILAATEEKVQDIDPEVRGSKFDTIWHKYKTRGKNPIESLITMVIYTGVCL